MPRDGEGVVAGTAARFGHRGFPTVHDSRPPATHAVPTPRVSHWFAPDCLVTYGLMSGSMPRALLKVLKALIMAATARASPISWSLAPAFLAMALWA